MKFLEWLADYERRHGVPFTGAGPNPPVVAPPVVDAPAKKTPDITPCVHLGVRLPGQPCGGPLMRCDWHGDITTRFVRCEHAQRHCAACPEMMTRGQAMARALTPRWTHQFGPGLIPNANQTNCSLMPWRGRLLLAYRTGWFGSRIHAAEIHEGMRPGPSRTLALRHPLGVGGREDPRLFVHDDALHMSYIGVRIYRRDGKEHTVARQLFVRLDDGLNVVREWEPAYAATTEWEKNWQPFSHGGRLFVVYSMRPWVVLELAGDRAVPVSHHPGVPWSFGFARGGAAPVLHNGEWYCFFHGTDKRGHATDLPAIYTVGVCTFEDKPPFRPLRITREPILWPVMEDLPPGPVAGRWYAATAFPCGAYLDRDQWVMSYGHNDHWCRASAFGVNEIEDRLCPVK